MKRGVVLKHGTREFDRDADERLANAMAHRVTGQELTGLWIDDHEISGPTPEQQADADAAIAGFRGRGHLFEVPIDDNA